MHPNSYSLANVYRLAPENTNVKPKPKIANANPNVYLGKGAYGSVWGSQRGQYVKKVEHAKTVKPDDEREARAKCAFHYRNTVRRTLGDLLRKKYTLLFRDEDKYDRMCNGQTLRAYLSGKAKTDMKKLFHVTAETLLNVLPVLNAQGIFHDDIKPENMMLCEDPHDLKSNVKIIDWDARLDDFLATPRYAIGFGLNRVYRRERDIDDKIKDIDDKIKDIDDKIKEIDDISKVVSNWKVPCDYFAAAFTLFEIAVQNRDDITNELRFVTSMLDHLIDHLISYTPDHVGKRLIKYGREVKLDEALSPCRKTPIFVIDAYRAVMKECPWERARDTYNELFNPPRLMPLTGKNAIAYEKPDKVYNHPRLMPLTGKNAIAYEKLAKEDGEYADNSFSTPIAIVDDLIKCMDNIDECTLAMFDVYMGVLIETTKTANPPIHNAMQFYFKDKDKDRKKTHLEKLVKGYRGQMILEYLRMYINTKKHITIADLNHNDETFKMLIKRVNGISHISQMFRSRILKTVENAVHYADETARKGLAELLQTCMGDAKYHTAVAIVPAVIGHVKSMEDFSTSIDDPIYTHYMTFLENADSADSEFQKMFTLVNDTLANKPHRAQKKLVNLLSAWLLKQPTTDSQIGGRHTNTNRAGTKPTLGQMEYYMK